MSTALLERNAAKRVVALADSYAEELLAALPLPDSLAPALSGTLVSFLVDAVRMVQSDE